MVGSEEKSSVGFYLMLVRSTPTIVSVGMNGWRTAKVIWRKLHWESFRTQRLTASSWAKVMPSGDTWLDKMTVLDRSVYRGHTYIEYFDFSYRQSNNYFFTIKRQCIHLNLISLITEQKPALVLLKKSYPLYNNYTIIQIIRFSGCWSYHVGNHTLFLCNQNPWEEAEVDAIIDFTEGNGKKFEVFLYWVSNIVLLANVWLVTTSR